MLVSFRAFHWHPVRSTKKIASIAARSGTRGLWQPSGCRTGRAAAAPSSPTGRPAAASRRPKPDASASSAQPSSPRLRYGQWAASASVPTGIRS
jgi:hypothetical protein